MFAKIIPLYQRVLGRLSGTTKLVGEVTSTYYQQQTRTLHSNMLDTVKVVNGASSAIEIILNSYALHPEGTHKSGVIACISLQDSFFQNYHPSFANLSYGQTFNELLPCQQVIAIAEKIIPVGKQFDPNKVLNWWHRTSLERAEQAYLDKITGLKHVRQWMKSINGDTKVITTKDDQIIPISGDYHVYNLAKNLPNTPVLFRDNPLAPQIQDDKGIYRGMNTTPHTELYKLPIELWPSEIVVAGTSVSTLWLINHVMESQRKDIKLIVLQNPNDPRWIYTPRTKSIYEDYVNKGRIIVVDPKSGLQDIQYEKGKYFLHFVDVNGTVVSVVTEKLYAAAGMRLRPIDAHNVPSHKMTTLDDISKQEVWYSDVNVPLGSNSNTIYSVAALTGNINAFFGVLPNFFYTSCIPTMRLELMKHGLNVNEDFFHDLGKLIHSRPGIATVSKDEFRKEIEQIFLKYNSKDDWIKFDMIYGSVPQEILQKFTKFLANLSILENMKIDPQVLPSLNAVEEKLKAFRDKQEYTMENLFILIEDVEKDIGKLVSHLSSGQQDSGETRDYSKMLLNPLDDAKYALGAALADEEKRHKIK
jgi:hypothetical protein